MIKPAARPSATAACDLAANPHPAPTQVVPRERLLNPRYERWRWRTFGITWLVYASYYFTRKSFGVAKVAFASDPSVLLSRQQLGLVDSTFLATYSFGQFIFGPLVDRFGPRLILLIGMSLSVATAVGNGFAKTAAAVPNIRGAARNRAVDRLDGEYESNGLMVFAAGTRPRAWLVVYPLHGRCGDCCAIRRMADGRIWTSCRRPAAI